MTRNEELRLEYALINLSKHHPHKDFNEYEKCFIEAEKDIYSLIYFSKKEREENERN